MIVDLTIGEAIHIERFRRHMTIKELADLSDVSEATISEYEHGLAAISTENLLKICRVLDIQLDKVFSPKQKEPVGTGIFEENEGITE